MKFDPAINLYDIQDFGEHGGVNPSIADSATFTFMKAGTMVDTFHGETEGCFLYSRHWNPSTKCLADAIASIEGTPAAWVTASGMGAITAVFLQLCNAGDHIVACRTIYGGTYAFLKNYVSKFNIDVTFVDITNLEEVENAIQSNTKMVYTETMTNPLLDISDVPKLSKITKEKGVKLVVDNTFTPMMFSTYQMGADIVVYSITKFLNGTNDTVGGAICASEDFINELIDVNDGTAMLLGATMDSLRANSVLKNLHTLHIRMKQHSKNALYLSKKLVELGIDARYAGLKTHPQFDLINSMLNKEFGYGGMIIINVDTFENASKLMQEMQNSKVGYLAVSLGYFKTLFSCPGASTSSELKEEDKIKMGLTNGMVRFSVGLDNDIELTFKRIKKALVKLNLI